MRECFKYAWEIFRISVPFILVYGTAFIVAA